MLAVPNFVYFTAKSDGFGELSRWKVGIVLVCKGILLLFFLEYLFVDSVKVLHHIFFIRQLAHEFGEGNGGKEVFRLLIIVELR